MTKDLEAPHNSQPEYSENEAKLLDILSRLFPADFAELFEDVTGKRAVIEQIDSEPAASQQIDSEPAASQQIDNKPAARPGLKHPAEIIRDMDTSWLNKPISRPLNWFDAIRENIQAVQSEEQTVKVVRFDPEMGRLAYSVGLFPAFRAWLYLRANNVDGSGRLERATVARIWKQAGISTSERHTRRLIAQGQGIFWENSRMLKTRLYLAGIARVARNLIERTGDTTNKPGGKQNDILEDLTGDISKAIAAVYAAWIARKTGKNGLTISRAKLQVLWNVEVKTLLRWEEIAGITKQANYAQQNDTSIDKVPKHAYLCLHRENRYFASWRLPNTYSAKAKNHQNKGKSRKVRISVNRHIDDLLQRGLIVQLAPPVEEKLYFDTFAACEKKIRRIARKDGNISISRYFSLGMRHGVQVYEPFDCAQNRPVTTRSQRLIYQERKDRQFMLARNSYAIALKD